MMPKAAEEKVNTTERQYPLCEPIA